CRSVSGPNATVSRRETGAVWWLMPRTYRLMGRGDGCGARRIRSVACAKLRARPPIVPALAMPNPQRSGPRPFPLVALLAALLACTAVVAGNPAAAQTRVDPLEASLAGEFALQGGLLPEAARHYLDAARAAQDPVLAE